MKALVKAIRGAGQRTLFTFRHSLAAPMNFSGLRLCAEIRTNQANLSLTNNTEMDVSLLDAHP